MLIINLVDSYHGWRNTIIRVSKPCEATSAKDRGRVLIAWNRGSLPKEMEEMVQKLYQFPFDYWN